ncbi:MAG TPA: RDD family protein [Marmoricola sp.]|nr:RDD family protein [Marmoricola sp.]
MAEKKAPPGSAAMNEVEHASWPRRIGALVIDWIACVLVTILLLGPARYSQDSTSGLVVLAVYFVEASLGTAFAGGSLGQVLVGIRVLRVDGRPLSLLAAALRTFLICLVVPPLIYKPENGRGLHDLATHAEAYRIPRR